MEVLSSYFAGGVDPAIVAALPSAPAKRSTKARRPNGQALGPFRFPPLLALGQCRRDPLRVHPHQRRHAADAEGIR